MQQIRGDGERELDDHDPAERMTPGPEAPPPASPPGWYQDASDPGLDRYWDGTQWVNDWRPSARTAPQQPPPAQGPDRPAGRSWNFWWYAASIAGIAIGAFGPWVTVLAFSRSGFDGDGQLTLGAAVLALIVYGHMYPSEDAALAARLDGLASAKPESPGDSQGRGDTAGTALRLARSAHA